jgi:hypothetical protein
MNIRLPAIVRAVALSALLAVAPVVPAAGGSGILCSWPDLDTWLPKAELVTVVRVERIRPAGKVRPGRIQLTVEDVLRGRSPRHITVRAFDADGMPDDPECTSPTIEVERGDRLVMGFASGIDRVSGPVRGGVP